MVFRNSTLNDLNREWNHFSHVRSLDQKTHLTKMPHLVQRFQNGCHKQEVELSKQEMELFLPINVHAIFWSQKIVQFDPFPSVNHSPY